ncbi:hypothetical protein B0H11DRAFT_207567 [Mycena galericulata]|nr:hypothetical protein B0H11DRAFT_207567 [Mycena galericulata]
MAPLPPPIDFESRIARQNELLHDLCREYPNLSHDIDLASMILSAIFVGIYLAAHRQADMNVASLIACKNLLLRKPVLYETLKLAHAAKDYTPVVESPLIPPLVSTTILSYLEKLRPEMEKLIRGDKTLEVWSPPAHLELDEDTLQHIEALKLRRPNPYLDVFSIILHDLGGFKSNPVLQDRTARIFTKENKFLVNTSGTGKTRLLYEGLCINWGLYFTVTVDDGWLGIRDIEDALRDKFGAPEFNAFPSREGVVPDTIQQDAMKQNSEFVYRVFSSLLLARLLVFQLFLEMATSFGLTEDHKITWLLMQLSPQLLNPPNSGFDFPPFEEWPVIMLKENDTHVRENIADALRKIRTLLGDDKHIFLVLDEAQVAARTFPGAFANEKPLLPEIMRVWGNHMTQDRTFICAGTNIPKSLFDGVDGEGSSYLWGSDTGGFDIAEDQSRYVTRFLPPTFIASPSGSLLISRISNWLGGRHRFTASFVYALLREGFKTPHTRFNAYVRRCTGFDPVDAVEQVQAEGREAGRNWEANFSVLDFSNISTEVKSILLDILLRYMATHEASPPFGPEHIDLVSHGFARFVDADLCTIVMDEPLVLIGAARKLLPHPSSRPAREKYLPDHPNDYPETFVGSMRLNVPRTPQAFSHCLVFYLARMFSRPQVLGDVFNFPRKTPGWAKQSAHLVKFHGNERLELEHSFLYHEDFSTPLATGTKSTEETISWLDHRYGTVFCLPSSSNVDLLFSLKLADQSLIWVALRAIPSAEAIPDSELKTALSQLELESLFSDEDDVSLRSRAVDAMQALPNRSAKHSLLRVVSSFPADIDLAPCVGKRSSDVASLSLTTFEGTEDDVTQPEFFDRIVAGVLAGCKRKSAGDEGTSEAKSPKRRKSDDTPEDDLADPAAGTEFPAPQKKQSPGRVPAAKPKKKKDSKEKAVLKAPEPSSSASSAPVSHNTRSRTRTTKMGEGKDRTGKGKRK